jgi:two-component system invasion response regulator UvrY
MLTDDLPAKAKKKNDHTAQNKLSARELEVIRYIKKGHTSKEIAELMHLSSYTVDTHRKNICRKLNISSPNALVKFVHENDF